MRPRRSARGADGAAALDVFDEVTHSVILQKMPRKHAACSGSACLSTQPTSCRVKLSNCAADLGVVRQRQRHAGVERRRHRAVVARERVMDAVAERGLDLLRRDQVLIGDAVEQDLDALAAGAELPDALDQPLRVADRRHVGLVTRKIVSAATARPRSTR
jgi:hypothetical protein